MEDKIPSTFLKKKKDQEQAITFDPKFARVPFSRPAPSSHPANTETGGVEVNR